MGVSVIISKIGKMLVTAMLITEEQLEKALAFQQKEGGRTGSLLVKLGYIQEQILLQFLSKQYGVQSVDLSKIDIDPSVTKLIPTEVVQKYNVIPIRRVGAVLTMAMMDPSNVFAIDDIKAYEKKFRVRYRIDGVLYEVMNPPMKLRAALTSRLKIMAELDIAERRLPKDGRIKLKMKDKEIDLRVSTLPCLFGEKVVMRILDKSALSLDLRKMGWEQQALDDLMKAIHSPYGMVLVTGPTGSGKSTTLYAALQQINEVGINIMTAEDPVEYNLFGVNQVQMKEEIGLNFAAALRSFLRQDPDVVLVGEIRDYETAEIGVKAALTGHLVLSTLHTNDAPNKVSCKCS